MRGMEGVTNPNNKYTLTRVYLICKLPTDQSR